MFLLFLRGLAISEKWSKQLLSSYSNYASDFTAFLIEIEELDLAEAHPIVKSS